MKNIKKIIYFDHGSDLDTEVNKYIEKSQWWTTLMWFDREIEDAVITPINFTIVEKILFSRGKQK